MTQGISKHDWEILKLPGVLCSYIKSKLYKTVKKIIEFKKKILSFKHHLRV